MVYYFIYSAEGPDVQSGLEERLKIEWNDSEAKLDKYLDEVGYAACVENFESYGGDSEEYEEETGIEWEADYYFKRITEQKYEDCGLNDFDIRL